MVHVAADVPGTPCWAELETFDRSDATRFYRALFGWTIDDAPPGRAGHQTCALDGHQVAGIGPQSAPDVPARWTTFVGVTDADATATLIVANGGTVAAATAGPLDGRRVAIATDPSGAVFSICQPGLRSGSGVDDEVGTVCWYELVTQDKVAAIAFYSAVFGWRPHHHGEGAADYVEFHRDDQSVAGLLPIVEASRPVDPSLLLPNLWLVYFAVDDVDDMAARVVELGGAIVTPPTDILPGRFAIVDDPQGATFSMLTFRLDAA